MSHFLSAQLVKDLAEEIHSIFPEPAIHYEEAAMRRAIFQGAAAIAAAVFQAKDEIREALRKRSSKPLDIRKSGDGGSGFPEF